MRTPQRQITFLDKPSHLSRLRSVAGSCSANFRVLNRYVGNLAPMPGVFPDYPAPIIRNAGAERELIMMRWDMPPPPKSTWSLVKLPSKNWATIGHLAVWAAH